MERCGGCCGDAGRRCREARRRGAFELERIEALRGPQPPPYGRSAAAGVVHVIGRSPRPGRTAASASLELGS